MLSGHNKQCPSPVIVIFSINSDGVLSGEMWRLMREKDGVVQLDWPLEIEKHL